MNIIYLNQNFIAQLTIDSVLSSYGLPVLRITDMDGCFTDYGPLDKLPSGIMAKALCESTHKLQDQETKRLASQFMGCV